MQRVMWKRLTFNKNRYYFLIDTDGERLYPRCHKGSSENGEEVGIEDIEGLKARLYELITDTEGSGLAHNALYSPDRIDSQVYKYHGVKVPPTSNIAIMADTIQSEGMSKLRVDIPGLEQYIEAQDIRFIRFEYGPFTYYFTDKDKAQEESKKLTEVIEAKKREIEELRQLERKLDDASYYLSKE